MGRILILLLVAVSLQAQGPFPWMAEKAEK